MSEQPEDQKARKTIRLIYFLMAVLIILPFLVWLLAG